MFLSTKPSLFVKLAVIFPVDANDQLRTFDWETKFLPALNPLFSSKLLFPTYWVPSPIVKNEPDFILTLSVPLASFIFNPGVILLNSTVFCVFTN